MRLIGHLTEEREARAFGDYLYVQGIANQLEHEKQDGWGIWISDEDQVGRASGLLEEFRKNPGDAKYVKEGREAQELREKEKKEQQEYRKRVKSRRNLFGPMGTYSVGPLTFVMLIACLAIFTWSKFGNNLEPVRGLLISDYLGGILDKSLPEVRHGQVWRLVTPIFIHFGIWHIVFNMMALIDFGSMVEGRQSSWHLLALTVVIGALSNLAQFYSHGPVFGGMSGVIYGLLGYIWIRGRLDPGSGLYLHRFTVIYAMVWFFACLLHVIPNVANAAHAVGLVIGIVWGWVSSFGGGHRS
jgi:GlpG protein